METYKLNFTILDLEVLSYLSLRCGEKLSQREIALALKVSPTAVKNSIDNLKDLVKVEKTKTINFISYNRDNPLAIKLKRIDNLKHLELSGLVEYLEKKFGGATIILFGSYSKGKDSINSDIDIAIIGRKDKVVSLDKYENALFRKINLNFYPSFKEIHKHLKNNILNGIVLVGSVDL